MRQLNLFDSSTHNTVSYSVEDFFITDNHREAFELVCNKWHDNVLLLTGSPYSGKTHLARVWQHKTGAVDIDINRLPNEGALFTIIENHNHLIIDMGTNIQCDDFIEKCMLHAVNFSREIGVWLLIVARDELIINIKLEDLKSRILSLPTANIRRWTLDDKATRMILLKQMSDMQIKISEEHCNLVVHSIKKDFASIKKMSTRIYEYVTYAGKNLTRNQINFIMEEINAKEECR